MSILYSILKPIIKKAVKGNLNQETYEEFAQVSRELQAKFKFQLPQKSLIISRGRRQQTVSEAESQCDGQIYGRNGS